jgi:predicted RNase H-like HicB family nuclease
MPNRATTKRAEAKRRATPRRPTKRSGPPAGCALGRYAVVVFWSDEDECYIADPPDLRGCTAFGDTPEEALREIQVAMQAWLETAREVGLRIPQAHFGPGVWNWQR